MNNLKIKKNTMITKFKQFEASHFHTMKDIDVILDKISATGLESLDPFRIFYFDELFRR